MFDKGKEIKSIKLSELIIDISEVMLFLKRKLLKKFYLKLLKKPLFYHYNEGLKDVKKL